MIRVVAGPDGTACFDLEGRLPGRGAWVCPAPSCVEALTAGALAHVLRAPAALAPPPQRRALLAQALGRRVGNLLSMARRARGVVFGQTGVRAVLGEGRAHLLLVAGDLSPDAAAAWAERAGEVPVCTLPDAATIGELAGRAPAAVAAVTDQGLAAALRPPCERLRAFGANSCDNVQPGRGATQGAARGSAAAQETGGR